MSPGVFISYAKEDKAFAARLYVDLRNAGVRPWIDSVDLMPGQIWEKTIEKTINGCSYFIAILSKRSVGKKGYVQNEIRIALEIAGQLPEGRIFIIPLRIDDCESSFEALRKLHTADFFHSYQKGLEDLLRSVNYEAKEQRVLFKVEAPRAVGVIETLTGQGVGFITPDFLEVAVFFHWKELQGITFDELSVGDLVSLSLAVGPKGIVAIDVERA
jgi:cold shock CspA family protein